MTKRYTAADFANAKFAEHEDGRVVARCDPAGRYYPWEAGTFSFSDEDLADEGWVPVPTKPQITESEFKVALKDSFGKIYYYAAKKFAEQLGIEVTPDPEPTDEELLAGIIRNIDDWQSITSPELLAKYLNTAGVTPPNVKGN